MKKRGLTWSVSFDFVNIPDKGKAFLSKEEIVKGLKDKIGSFCIAHDDSTVHKFSVYISEEV